MQPLVKRHANGENTTARARAGFEDDDRCAGLVKKISRAQAGETGADDDNGLVGIEPHAVETPRTTAAARGNALAAC